MNIEQFKKWLDNHVSDTTQDAINKPSSLSENRAYEEAQFLIEDLESFYQEKDKNVCVVVFEYKDGYQVDVESAVNPSFQIFGHLYSPSDIEYVLKYDNTCTIKKLQVK